MNISNFNLEEKFAKINGYWHPYIVGELNENYVKLAKLKGELVWHSHEEEDEMFVVVSGTLMMDFRDGRTTQTKPGEILIVPKAVEHRPWTKEGEEVKVMLIEPKSTKHTVMHHAARTKWTPRIGTFACRTFHRDTKASKRANLCHPRHDVLSQNNIYLIDKLKYCAHEKEILDLYK